MEEPEVESFDFVIVGGGTAGCVLAAGKHYIDEWKITGY
jgi:2-polyprenyl-6-methoxyphenol hydroxylase-like FAD-dependent oxidoreductase